MKQIVKVIKDPKEVQEKLDIAKNSLESSGMFNRAWLIEKNWYPVIDQDNLPYPDDEVEHLINVLKQSKIKMLFAVNIDGAKALPKVISFPCTVEGFFAFMKLCSGFHFIVFDHDVKFALLCTSNSYHIFASSFELVQQFYKGRASDILEEFNRFALSENDPWKSKALERYVKCKFHFDLANNST